MKNVVLLGQDQQNEIEMLQKDTILIGMYNAIPAHVELEDIPFSIINVKYKEFGGKHNALRIGSIKDALLKMFEVEVAAFKKLSEMRDLK